MHAESQQVILTTVNGSSRETKLRINWRGMTPEQMQTLAQRYLIQAVQNGYKKLGSAPAVDAVDAAWYLDRTPATAKPLGRIRDLPEHLQGKRDKEEMPQKVDCYAFLDEITEEQREQLLKILQES